MKALLSVLLLAAVAVPGAAQENEIRAANLPRELEWRLLRMYEGAARRMDGGGAIGAGERIEGDVAAYGGVLRIAGTITGDVAMVGGDVALEPGGSVLGNVTVVGGQATLADDGRVAGSITSYGLGTGRSDDPWRDRGRDRDRWEGRDRYRWRDAGYSSLTLRAGSGYNRVEGLPVMFGPVIQTGGRNPLRLEALAIWRTEPGGLDTDRMGYQVTAEQFLGGRRELSAGVSGYSLVEPLDRWQLSDLEASLGTVLFHEDLRDYHDRTGWSVFLRAEPARWLEGRVEFRSEDHAPVPAGDPWALFGGGPWRLQPVVARGNVRSLAGSLTVDFRDDDDDPATGWFARLGVERPVGGALVRPALTEVTPAGEQRFLNEPVPSTVPETPLSLDFTTALLDVRRYLPVGYESQLSLRLVAGGALSERALPPQFQHALGGPGTLPGFDTFLADCGARAAAATHEGERFSPAYGCDRFALAQVEYRGTLSLDFGFGDPDWDDHWWDEVRIDMSPTWVVFFDAGRGWGYEEPAFPGERDTGMLYDAGAGFLLGDLGIYAALPLNGDVDQEPRFFLRLGRRF